MSYTTRSIRYNQSINRYRKRNRSRGYQSYGLRMDKDNPCSQLSRLPDFNVAQVAEPGFRQFHPMSILTCIAYYAPESGTVAPRAFWILPPDVQIPSPSGPECSRNSRRSEGNPPSSCPRGCTWLGCRFAASSPGTTGRRSIERKKVCLQHNASLIKVKNKKGT